MYDRERQEAVRRRTAPTGRVVGRGTRQAAFGACLSIFEAAFDAARFAIAQQPLAFAITDAIDGRTAGVAAVRGPRPRRFSHRFIASRPIAKNRGIFFCCVTTRGTRSRSFPRRIACGCPALASLAFGLGVLPAAFRSLATLLLPLGGLPAMQLLETGRFLAVALIVPRCLKPSPTAFAETSSPP